jgi:hypothetical protein
MSFASPPQELHVRSAGKCSSHSMRSCPQDGHAKSTWARQGLLMALILFGPRTESHDQRSGSGPQAEVVPPDEKGRRSDPSRPEVRLAPHVAGTGRSRTSCARRSGRSACGSGARRPRALPSHGLHAPRRPSWGTPLTRGRRLHACSPTRPRGARCARASCSRESPSVCCSGPESRTRW